MEIHRPFQKALGLCAFFTVLCSSGCGLSPEDKVYFEPLSTYPQSGQTLVLPFGSYRAVFTRPLSATQTEGVTATFPFRLSTSAETLFIHRTDPLPPYGRSDAFTLTTLTLADGSTQPLNLSVSFAIAAGENEDNGAPAVADTLISGQTLDGQTDRNDGSGRDRDYYLFTVDTVRTGLVTASCTDTLPLYFSCPLFIDDCRMVYGQSPVTLSFSRFTADSARVVLSCGPRSDTAWTDADTLQFMLSNEGVLNGRLTPERPGGWYRLRAENIAFR